VTTRVEKKSALPLYRKQKKKITEANQARVGVDNHKSTLRKVANDKARKARRM